ncbi:hypothetical protein TNCV_2412241 [Trichonephila clavipes]|nr:hypothetical protein TNCV_2412241 [Trichonephila clavipes]
MLDREEWTCSMQRAKNISVTNEFETDVCAKFPHCRIQHHRGQAINSRNQPRDISGRAIINIYLPLQSACGEKFIYTAGIAVIAFPPYGGSERIKHHRALSTHLSNHLLK